MAETVATKPVFRDARTATPYSSCRLNLAVASQRVPGAP
jgi:hypothetical protein